MLEEDLRSTILNQPKKGKELPEVEYEEIIEENI